mgnify:CR=1 FL=1
MSTIILNGCAPIPLAPSTFKVLGASTGPRPLGRGRGWPSLLHWLSNHRFNGALSGNKRQSANQTYILMTEAQAILFIAYILKWTIITFNGLEISILGRTARLDSPHAESLRESSAWRPGRRRGDGCPSGIYSNFPSASLQNHT